MLLETLTEPAKTLFPKLNNFPEFYLAGGTALALQIGHRISEDFDLFTDKPLKPELLNKIESVYPEKSGSPLVNNSNEITLIIDNVKFTFLYYPFPVLQPLVDLMGVKGFSVEEIGVTKAYTIGRRQGLKDYVDMYFMLSENHTSLVQVINLAEKKYGSQFNGKLFLQQLLYLDDVPNMDIKFLKGAVDKPVMLKLFENQINRFAL